MVLPVVEVKVTADTAQATANIDKFSDGLKDIPAASKKANAAAKNNVVAMKNMGAASFLASNRSRMLTQQLSQVAQQTTATGNVMQSFAIQAADIGLAFGVTGTILGALAGLALPVLSQSLFSASDGASDLDGALKIMDETAEAVRGNLNLLNSTSEELEETYGSAAARIREFAIAQAQLNVGQAAARLSDQVSILGDLADRYRITEGQMSAFAASEGRLLDDFGVHGADALRLSQALVELGDAVGPSMQADGLQKVFDLLQEMEIPLTDIPEDLQVAINEMITLGAETARVEELMRQLSAAAAGVTTGTPLFMQDLSGGLLPPAGDDGGGGGGGRGGNARLEALIRSLQTEQELAEQFRADGLAALEAASAQELEVLGGINEAKLRLEQEYQDRLAGIKKKGNDSQLALTLGAGSDILNALGAFNDKAFKLAKVAGAAQALISTFQGAAEALKLPFPANLSAAAAVTAKGLGLVAAIKGVSSSGTSGGGGGGAGAAAAAPVAAQSPLNVRLSGLGAGDSITGGQLSSLFDRLQNEAGDRGLQVSFAP